MPPTPDSSHYAAFPATQWTLIKQACQDDNQSDFAVEKLCQDYWYPIYAFLRGKGSSPHDAEDLTQGFFQKLIAENLFQLADQDRGRLRSFLLTILKRYVSNIQKSVNAKKRGGDVRLISLDFALAEDRFANEPASTMDPEKVYLQAWAHGLLNQAREQLRIIYRRAPRSDIAEALDPYLDPEEDRVPYQQLAQQFSMSEGALRLHVFRLRQKLGDLVKEAVRQTVDSPEDFENELNWFRAIMLQ